MTGMVIHKECFKDFKKDHPLDADYIESGLDGGIFESYKYYESGWIKKSTSEMKAEFKAAQDIESDGSKTE